MLIKSFKQECASFIENKINLLVLFIIPVLVLILLGVELSKGIITDIPIAVINYDNSSFSRQLVEKFDQNETFNVKSYPANEQELEKLMKNSQVRAGLIIPENFYNDIASLKSPTILMVYDGSHMSITSAAKAKATEILLTYKAGAAIQQLTGRLNMSYKEAYNVAQAFQFNNRVMYNSSKSFEFFLTPVLLAGYIQSAIALTAAVCVDQKIYCEEKMTRLGYASGKVMFYTLFGSMSMMICMILQIVLFNVPFKGKLMNLLILTVGLTFSVAAFCVLISSLIKNRMVCLVGGAVLFIPNSAMAGTTWPIISMPAGYQSFARYMPFAHYANNVRDIYLKGISVQQIIGDVSYLFLFGAIILILTELVMIIADKELEDKEVMNDDLPGDIHKGIPLDI